MAEPPTPTLSVPGIEDLEPIGRGGFGTVYSGWQEALGRKVAVKILHAPAGDVEAATRLRREGMAMGALSHHPNVVPVYESGFVDDRPYLVMPFLPDGSLAEQLRSGPLPPRAVVELGQGLADALAAAHEAGVLHRDVKPANVLRTPHGTYQLADFGVARFVDATQTLGGTILATVGYAAPEVLDGGAATPASDIYSLGATLHAALRGRAPFESGPDDAPIALAVRVLTTPPPDLRLAGVPSALAEVVEKAMAREPADRYSSAADLRDALGALELAPSRPVPDAAGAAAVTAVLPPAVLPPAVLPPAVLPPAPTLRTAPVTKTEPPPRRRAAAPPRPTPGRVGRVVTLLGLLGLLVAAAIVLITSRGEDGTPHQSSGESPAAVETTTTQTAAPETTTPQTTTTFEPVTTATTLPATTATPPRVVTPSAVQAVRDYYALMDAGQIDEGFTRLSTAYQERTGETSYRRFWETIDGVEVLDAQADGLTVDATLRYTRTDATTSTEAVTLRLVSDPGTGALLIDDYRLR